MTPCGSRHDAPRDGSCPCGAVSRHPAATPAQAGDEAIVADLAEALDHETWCNRAAPVLDDDDIACADNRLSTARLLLPVVHRIAEQRAAEELLAAAQKVDQGRRYGTFDLRANIADALRNRAAALTATPNHGRNAT